MKLSISGTGAAGKQQSVEIVERTQRLSGLPAALHQTERLPVARPVPRVLLPFPVQYVSSLGLKIRVLPASNAGNATIR